MKQNVIYLLKGVLFSSLLMTCLIFLLALVLQLTGWSDSTISLLIILSFGLCGFLGGLYFAKHADKRRYLWGLLFGGTYFLVYLAASFLLSATVPDLNQTLTMLACALGFGCLGGMLS